MCHSKRRRQSDRKYTKLLRRIGHDTVPFFSVELHDCLQNEMCQCRVLRAAGEFPNRLMWRWINTTWSRREESKISKSSCYEVSAWQCYIRYIRMSVWFSFHLLRSTKHTTLGPAFILAGNRDSPVGTASRLRNGKPRYRSSILGRSKWFLSSPKVSISALLSTQPLLPPTCLHRVRAPYFVCSSDPFSNQSRAPPYVTFTKKHFVVTYSISSWYTRHLKLPNNTVLSHVHGPKVCGNWTVSPVQVCTSFLAGGIHIQPTLFCSHKPRHSLARDVK
jgi:hypothetical protein